jgi:hypothetical protein
MTAILLPCPSPIIKNLVTSHVFDVHHLAKKKKKSVGAVARLPTFPGEPSIRPHGITSQKTAGSMLTAATASNLTKYLRIDSLKAVRKRNLKLQTQ